MNEMKSEAPSIISGSTFIARITNWFSWEYSGNFNVFKHFPLTESHQSEASVEKMMNELNSSNEKNCIEIRMKI